MFLNNVSYRDDEEHLLPLSPSPDASDASRATWRHHISSISLRTAVLQFISFMRPSFLNKQATLVEITEKVARRKSSTEYLDGVRGVASLIVFILHWSHNPYPSVNSGWGHGDKTSLWLLPFIRLVYSGAAMVSVFFVVSGFVLSHRFVQRMHRQEYPELFAALTSITWRRAIRLFLPAFASSLMALLCVCLGIIDVPKKVNGQPFKHGLVAYLDFLDAESNPWDWAADYSGFYNPQLWSIAVEFRGSMVVFLMIMALARTRTSVRLAVEGFLTVHCFAHRRWDIALFLAGMVIAELQVLLQKPKGKPRLALVNVLLVIALVTGVFLSGYPRDNNAQTPGYMWTKHVWPVTAYRRRFWLAISAILIVGSMAFLPTVQSVFLTRPARYLGRISFALYLVHGLGNRTVGKWLLKACWKFIGKEGFWSYTISFVVSTSLYFPFVIWLSDIFWRCVDIPSTDFAKWFEKKCASSEHSRSQL
jgi:peptidoglycan/LPS O-acetylase OafA/YrhL